MYMNVEAPRNMAGLAILIEVVGEYSTYKAEIVGKAKVRACDNCKLLMSHANIVYKDWCNRANFFLPTSLNHLFLTLWKPVQFSLDRKH
jgi:hypothetical protein